MLKQVRFGFIHLSQFGISEPGPFAWIVVRLVFTAEADIEVSIQIVETAQALLAFAYYADGDPAILRVCTQLFTYRRISVQVNEFIKVPVLKTDINGIEQRVAVHGFGKQLTRVFGDTGVADKTGELGQNSGGRCGPTIYCRKIIPGAGSCFLIHRQGRLGRHIGTEEILQADSDRGCNESGEQKKTNNGRSD